MAWLHSLFVKITFLFIITKPQPIVLDFLPIMLLSNAQKFPYYAQYYAIMPQFVYDLLFLMTRLAWLASR